MISVIVPSHNEEKNIERCINSLRSQKFDGNYEIILADGKSTDRTVEKVEHLVDRVIMVESKGPARARNEGARIAKYPIVAFIDADSVAHELWLSRIEKNFQEDIIGVGGIVRPLDPQPLDNFISFIDVDIWIPLCSLFGIYLFNGSSCAFLREPFLKVNGFNEKISFFEDTEITFRIKKLGKLKIDKKMIAYSSVRRFREQGYIKVGLQYFKAFWDYTTRKQVEGEYFGAIKK
ncbi:MAG: glycosyltransferase [Candidatus Micrarchaeia archaeon]